MPKPDGFTYIVWATGTNLYKIGFSNDVDRRIGSLKSGSPHPLEVILTVPGTHVEKILHGIFADYRKHGEWFEFDNDLTLTMVKAAAYQQSRPPWRRHLRAVS